MKNHTITTRHQKLLQHLSQSDFDALILNPGPSMVYMTGLHFHLSERPVIVIFTKETSPIFVLPELESPKLQSAGYDNQFFTYGEEPTTWGKIFKKALTSAGIKAAKIGAEPRVMRFLEMELLKEAAPETTFQSAEDLIAQLRMQKDAHEIASMQKAAQIAQKALKATLPKIKIGTAEKEIAAELSLQLLRGGSNPQLPFFPIVSTGPNSANPHASPSDRKLAEGDLLVIDYGANVDGYFSDITRTFGVGKVSAELEKIHHIVHLANQAGHKVGKPGIAAKEIDIAARAIIEEAGYGEYFFHRTGHGLGMEGHEPPYIRGDNELILKPGMTFTIEPGIYLPGRGGVRIEDDVVITEDGLDSFTDLPRELITVG